MRRRGLLLAVLPALLALPGWGAPRAGVPIVNDGPGADLDAVLEGATTLTANWSGFTGAARYDFGIGTTPGSDNIYPFTDVGGATSATTAPLSLSVGTQYFASVAAYDALGMPVASQYSDGIQVVALNDGTGADIDALPVGTVTLQANWAGFSAVTATYEWAIGTTPGGLEVQTFVSVGLATAASSSPVNTVSGTTYYVTVRSMDGTGAELARATSDGALAQAPFINDGTGADIDTVPASATSLSANWGALDPAAFSYEWAVGTTPGAFDIYPFTYASLASGASTGPLTLTPGLTYYATVRTHDMTGLPFGAPVVSDGVLAVAAGATVGDGPPGTDLDGISGASATISAHWSGFPAAAVRFEWAIGTSAGAQDVRPFTNVGAATSAFFGPLTLVQDVRYFATVRAFDAADLPVGSPVSSNGALALGVLVAGDGTGADVDTVPFGTTTLSAAWSGGNPAAASYEWAVGTFPYDSDVMPFTNVGLAASAASGALPLASNTTYYVTVRALDSLGAVLDGAATTDGVLVLPPFQVVATPSSGQAPLTVAFTTPATGMDLYQWGFTVDLLRAGFTPDLTNSAPDPVSYTYSRAGTYTVRLRAHPPSGPPIDQDVTVTVTAAPNAPTLTLSTLPAPPTGPAPLAVVFTAAASAPAGVSAFLWDVNGDGVTDFTSGSVPSLTHTFTAPGTFNVEAVVVDGGGAQGAATVTVTVNPPVAGDPPQITSLTAVPGAALTGQVLTFSAQANPGATGSLSSFIWDFDGNGEGDRVTTTGLAGTVVETWQYETPGTFQARLTVVDSENLSASAVVTVPVTLDVATRRCWIVQPVRGAQVWGDFVSVLALAVPESSVTSIAFEVRPAGGPTWTPIGTALPVPEGVFGVHWDAQAAAGGPAFDLRAVATFAGGGTASSEAIELVTVTAQLGPPASPDTPYFEESSGSPFTQLKIVGVIPGSPAFGAITRDMVVKLLAGSTASYESMRLERRGENPHPVEGRLQAFKFSKFRKVSTAGNSPLLKLSKVTMYVKSDAGPTLADGTDLSTATFKIYRFEPARSRWEPLINQVSNPNKALVQASMAATGDLGVLVIGGRADSRSSSGCGSTGLGAAALASLLLARRRRRS